MADQPTNEVVKPETPVRPDATPKPVQPQIAATPIPRKPKQDRAPEEDPGIWRMNRRNALWVGGWLAFFGFIITSTVGALRYMFPRVLFEPPTKFKAGLPADYVVGEVSEKYKDEKRVWIVREKDGFYAIISICTHLGCTPRWLPSDNKFKCPCHGSGFYKSAINFEGPAPRAMERAFIGLADDGQIEIDRSVKFLYEKGEWGKQGSFLEYKG
ncbi:MAG: Rieske 2Fe-2S domain-containing protein [Bacteroidota bacterium]